MGDFAILLVSLGIILVGAEVFVNGVEWLGKKLDLSEGAVGSILAAIGTALPETIIPIIAILFSTGSHGHEIGIGAILGAPLMLATLAMFVTGIAVIVFSKSRKSGRKISANYRIMKQDLLFFLIAYTLAVLAGLIPPSLRFVQIGIAIFLVLSYVLYVRALLKQTRKPEHDTELPRFYLAAKNAEASITLIIIQIFIALTIIIIGAKLFVGAVSGLAVIYGVPAFILAIIITPIATELPEKFNSVIWISRDKDTLALGNITGAMTFQSSLIPALGIIFTDWQLSSGGLISAVFALVSALIIYISLVRKKRIAVRTLMFGGVLYSLFFIGVVQGFIN